jgi:hypothetical protein
MSRPHDAHRGPVVWPRRVDMKGRLAAIMLAGAATAADACGDA